jgi:hypothetical protein
VGLEFETEAHFRIRISGVCTASVFRKTRGANGACG